jgi:hypothetical protein
LHSQLLVQQMQPPLAVVGRFVHGMLSLLREEMMLL